MLAVATAEPRAATGQQEAEEAHTHQRQRGGFVHVVVVVVGHHDPDGPAWTDERIAAGTASVFLFSEPLAGWRQATARARRTKADWAIEVAGLLEGRYADCEKVTLVCDNLNTHTKGAFYEAFEPTRARELVVASSSATRRNTADWLNIAENELSAMTRQCLHGRRIGDLETLHAECRRGRPTSTACSAVSTGR